MALDLRISGPGLDVLRRLEPGAPALVLGRDADCDVRLPDPGRNVSRRHLGVWNEGDRLHFEVLSQVNGVDTSAGLLPPGTRGVLPPGEALGLAAYRLSVDPGDAGDADPWVQFEREAAQMLPEGGTQTLPTGLELDDPFSDWGFQSTFGAGVPADALQPATDLQPFLRGLGVAAAQPFTQGELETLGRVARIAVQALLQALPAEAAASPQAGPRERSLTEPRATNPLRLDVSLESKLGYLFGGQAAAAGFLPPDRALAQLATELAAHQEASSEAMRSAIEAIVRAFDPEALRQRSQEGHLSEPARAWEAFARDFAERYPQGDEWVAAIIDRHFAPAYALALVRAKRNTKGRDGG